MTETTKKPWVRLYLVPQTQPSPMPEFIVGKLEQETPSSYMLSSVIEEVDTEDGLSVQATEGMSFINRTYIWRLEILPAAPDLDFINAKERGRYFNDDGGLG